MNRANSQLQRVGVAIQAALHAQGDHPQLVLCARRRLVSRFMASRTTYGPRGRAQWRALWRWLGAGALFCFAVAVLGVWSWRERTLSFHVVGLAHDTETQVGDVIAAGDRGVDVFFSEGSAVTLAARSSARVLSLQPERARVLLESGELRAALDAERSGRRWAFEAGPFRAVTDGSMLHLIWNAARNTLTLNSDGSARVFASCLGAALEIDAGELHQITCPAGSDFDLVAR